MEGKNEQEEEKGFAYKLGMLIGESKLSNKQIDAILAKILSHRLNQQP